MIGYRVQVRCQPTPPSLLTSPRFVTNRRQMLITRRLILYGMVTDKVMVMMLADTNYRTTDYGYYSHPISSQER